MTINREEQAENSQGIENLTNISRSVLPPTKSNATIKAFGLGVLVMLILGGLGTYYLSGMLTIREKKKPEGETIASRGHFVLPEFKEPEPAKPQQIKPKAAEEVVTKENPIKFAIDNKERKPVEKEKNMFSNLLPTPQEASENKRLRPNENQSFNEEAEKKRAEREAEQARIKKKRQQEIFAPFTNTGSSTAAAEEGKSRTALQVRLSSSSLEKRVAGKMKDITYTIPEGTLIPCVLNTAINTNVIGYIKCTITDDVYGYDGNLVLIQKGAVITGEYKNGLEIGIDRLFVVWSRIRTANGLLVEIDSPGVGQLGEAGLGGKIDHRYLRRFGGSLMVSLLNDSISEDGGEKYTQTRDSAQNTAEKLIEKFADIPPILYKMQGEEILIFVSKDLSFKEALEIND